MATCGPGDEVLIPAPYWVSYPEMCRLAGAEPVVLPTAASEGFLRDAREARRGADAEIATPHPLLPVQPSGAVYPREHLAKLAEVCAKHPRLLVLSDEIYEHITYETEHASIYLSPDARARTLVVNGFSKAFAMTGWRLGYLAAPAHFAKAAASIQSQTTSGPSSISQEAGLAALKVLGPRAASRCERWWRRSGGGAISSAAEFARRAERLSSTIPRGRFTSSRTSPGWSATGARRRGSVRCRTRTRCVGICSRRRRWRSCPEARSARPSAARISYAAADDVLNEALDRIAEALSPDVYKVERE